MTVPTDATADPQSGGGHATDEAPPTLALSLFVETDITRLSTDGQATIGVRNNHGDVRIEAAEADRAVEAVLEGSPVAMAALADQLYAAAAAATDPPEVTADE